MQYPLQTFHLFLDTYVLIFTSQNWWARFLGIPLRRRVYPSTKANILLPDSWRFLDYLLDHITRYFVTS